MEQTASSISRRRALVSLGFAIAAAGYSGKAFAAYPTRNITLISPFAAGSSSDFIARQLAQHFQMSLGYPCIVENRPGAAGITGIDFVAKAAPDGHTLAYLSSATTIQPALMKLPYDIQKDLQPISLVIKVPYLLMTQAKSRLATLADLATEERSGRSITFGTYGLGSPPHLIMEQIQEALNVRFTHVPYKSTPNMLTDLLAGLIDVAWEIPNNALSHIEAGSLKALAVSGQERVPYLPNVPTLGETVPGLHVVGWGAMMAPAGVPKEIVELLQKQVASAVAEPRFAAKLKELGFVAVASSSQELADTIAHELASWKKLVLEQNIKIN